MATTIARLAELVGGTVEGDGSLEIARLAALDEAGPDCISFLAGARYASLMKGTRAAAVVVATDFDGDSHATLIRCRNPDAAFARIASEFAPPGPVDVEGVHPSAVVADGASLGRGVSVGPHCVVDDEVQVGDGTVIRAGSYLGRGARLGRECLIYPNVTIREGSVLGDRVIVHSGAVIGSDGFGYTVDGGRRVKIPQIGRVVVGDDVEIGANVTVDRARFGETVIGCDVKIDNLVQIAHNVRIGDGSVIVSLCAIAGSTTLGKGCVLGGQVAIDGHLVIGDHVMIAAKSGVTKDWPSGSVISGFPAIDHREDLRLQAELRRLASGKKRRGRRGRRQSEAGCPGAGE